MRWIISFVYILTHVFLVHTYDCGPGRSCECVRTDNITEIVGTGSNLSLPQICSYVSRRNITRVSYLNSNFKALVTGDFIGCENVKELQLQHGTLTTISDNAFLYVNELQKLDLRFNKLRFLYTFQSSCPFNHLINLISLSINGNFDENAENGSYPNLSCLKSLENLTVDGMLNAQFGFDFQNLNNLHSVSMSGRDGGFCDLRRVENETFEGLKFVKNLTISHCNLTGFDAGALVHLNHLERLDISYNQRVGFAILPNVSFGLQFTNIKFLNVSRLYASFGVGTILKKRHVCYLWNTSLEEVDYSGNRVEQLETNLPIIVPLTLTIAHANHNKFIFGAYLTQNSCFENVKQVYTNKAGVPLYLYWTEPSLIPNLGTNDGSECPFMEDSYMKDVSKQRQNCSFIEGHNIDPLSLLKIPRNIEKIEARDCKMFLNITSFPDTYNIIEYADFSGCFLFAWNGPIGYFHKLRYLDLSNNLCSYVSKSFFSKMPALETLLIQKNLIGLSGLSEETFQNLTKLTKLDISSNRLTRLPVTIFANLLNIDTLDLSNNILPEINFEFRTLGNLSSLDLSYNVIRKVQPELLRHLSDISVKRNKSFQIDLTGNVLTFSCEELDFLNLLLEHKNNCVNFDTYSFEDTAGRRVSGKDLLKELHALTIICSNGMYNRIIVSCSVGLMVFLIIIVGGCIYKHRWKFRFILHMAKRKYFAYEPVLKPLYNEDVEDFDTKYDAFISYAEEDVKFIRTGIIPELEDKGFKLCIHQRDFLAGNAIADNIMDAINASKKTIAIISENYVRKRWCIYEFQMARLESIYNRNNSLFVVMLENVPADSMQLEMIDWIGSESFLEYTTDVDGNALFWDRLRAYLREA